MAVLSEPRDPSELRAFEREYPDPVHRMRALGWRGPEDAAGVTASMHLPALRAQAESDAGRPVSWEQPFPPRPDATRGDRLFNVVAALMFGLVMLGGVSFLIQGVKTVLRWLGG